MKYKLCVTPEQKKICQKYSNGMKTDGKGWGMIFFFGCMTDSD